MMSPDVKIASRLGLYSATLNVDNGPTDMADSNSTKYWRGLRQYEITNHLGNVLATVSDKKRPVYSGGMVKYYDADVTTAQDYYPFGMQMPGRIGYQAQGGWVSEQGSGTDNSLPADLSICNRTNNLPPEYNATNSIELKPGFESGTADVFYAYISPDAGGGAPGNDGGSGSSSLNGAYRYGFNGKENDNEVKGVGNQQDYGMRIYDPRVGRFLSVDPIAKSYPELTPYQFAGNKPTNAIDIDGLEEWNINSPANMLKRTEVLYKVQLNPLQGIPQPQTNVFVSPTTKADIQKSTLYTEQVKTMNHLYNTDEGWSFRIFAGVGEGAVSFGEGEAIGYAFGKVGQGIKYLKNAASSSSRSTFVVPEPPPILNASKEANQIFSTPVGKTATQISVEDKLSRYLLNPEHPVGGSKANWFNQALGFNKNNANDLAKQIVFDPKKAVETAVTQYGTKYNQVIPITGANGKTIDVTFTWIKNNDNIVRLVGEIPAKK